MIGSFNLGACSLSMWCVGCKGEGDIIIMRRRTQKQLRQREQPPQQPPWQLLPSAAIQNYLHLHLSPYSPSLSNKKTPQSPPKQPTPSQQAPSIQIKEQLPNSIIFHHSQKMTPFSFHFTQIFDSKTKPRQAAGVIDLSRTLLEEGKDFCLIAMGGQEANISQFCGGGEGMGDSAGLLFEMLSQLWDRLQSMKAEASSSSPGVNSVRLSLKMLAIQQQKLYDMLSPKTQVTLKDSPTRTIITSASLPVMSVYDLHVKLQEISRQRRLLYPDSAAVFEAEVSISYEGYMITQEEVTTRLFTFIEWPRGGKEDPSKGPSSSHNNQALLTLNMCIYQLYKLSLRPPERVTSSQAKQLWAHFRNSPITMLAKHYFMGNSRVALLACLPLHSLHQNQNYQLLMLGKNLGKIDLKKFEECVLPATHAPTPPLGVQYKIHKKMKTEPVEVANSRGSSPDFTLATVPPNMRRLKENLQRILREKESAEQRQKEEELALLFKERKECRLELENIRYKREEIRIREDYGKLSQNQSRVSHPATDPPTLPLLQNNRKLSKPSTEELSKLVKDEEEALRKIDALQSRIVGSISNGGYGVSALKMEVRLQERQLVESIANKSRILAMLKGQLREIKMQEQQGKRQPKRKRKYMKSHSDHAPPIPHNTIQPEQEQKYQEQYTPVNPSKVHHEEDVPSGKRDPQSHNGSFRLQTLKKLNKNNYMFQKRRLALKAKLSKGRKEINQFYENAARKFQEYPRAQ